MKVKMKVMRPERKRPTHILIISYVCGVGKKYETHHEYSFGDNVFWKTFLSNSLSFEGNHFIAFIAIDYNTTSEIHHYTHTY